MGGLELFGRIYKIKRKLESSRRILAAWVLS